MNKIEQAVAEPHNKLNPKIWADNDHMLPEVQVALLRIAKEFYEFLAFDAPMVDVQVTGSQANYNYTDLSDLDLHLIVPYKDVECDEPVDDLFDTKRKLWKARHNISVHSVPVEVYVEDVGTDRPGAAYSLLSNEWLRKPKALASPDWNQEEIFREVLIWLERMSTVVGSRDIEAITTFKDQLSAYRKQGLSVGGEFSQQNIVYKALRNLGAISQLMEILVALKDKDLSI
jgi:hypothetical protein